MSLVILLAVLGESDPPAGFWDAPNQCAAWSVWHACNFAGAKADPAAIAAELPTDGAPKSLADMRRALAALGVASSPRRIDGREAAGDRPMIALLRLPADGRDRMHFVYVPGRDADRRFLVLDGLAAPTRWTPALLKHHWTGDCLELGANRPWAATARWWLAVPLLALAVPWRRLCRRSAVSATLAAAAAVGCAGKLPESPVSVREGFSATLVGKSEANGTAQAEVRFTFETAVPVRFGEPRSSCGCATATWEGPTELGAGQSRTLTVRIAGPERSGAKAAIRILTDVATQPEIILSVAMRPLTEPPWLASPQWVRKGNAVAGELMPIELATVEAAGSKPWITAVAAGTPLPVELMGEEALDAGLIRRQYRVTTTSPVSAEGIIRTALKLTVTVGKGPEVIVLHRNLPALVAEPATVRAGTTATIRFTDAKGVARRVRLRSPVPTGMTVAAEDAALRIAIPAGASMAAIDFEDAASPMRTASVAVVN